MTAYNRVATLKKTINSLSRCTGSKKDLFVYSDDGKNVADQQKVDAVRKYLDTMDIKVIRRKQNFGLRHNSLNAITSGLKDYDKIIFVTDDMEFSTDFLKYMDWALNKLEDNKDIMFVAGYSHINYPNCYLSPLLSCPMGIWRDKFSYSSKTRDYKAFAKHTAPHYADNLREIDMGKIDAFMALLSNEMYLLNKRCLHPNGNKVRHLINDSETHAKKRDSKKFNNVLFTGFSRVIDPSDHAYNIIKKTKSYKWGLLKKTTRKLSAILNI